jgi:hypothetical protein
MKDDTSKKESAPASAGGLSIEQRVGQLEEFVSYLADKIGLKKLSAACPKHPDAGQSVNGCTAPGCTFPG